LKALVHDILLFLTGLGYWGILLGLMIEVIPSEIVLAYAGFLVQQGTINFAFAVIFGVIGGTIAQIFIYWIGRYGGRPFLDKYGKYLLIKDRQIDLAEEWFNRYGTGVIFTARFIPVVRHAISLPAGMARMSLLRFTVYTALAIIPWSILFIYLGQTLGANWQDINTKASPYIWPFIWAAIVLTVIYFGYKLLRRKSQSNTTQGYIGEKNTALELKALSGEYRVLHGRTVRSRGTSQDIDHLVIGPNGLFHIETKNWHGSIRFTEKGIERSQPEHHDDPTAQLTRHEFVLKELLRAHKIEAEVVGILNFADPQSEIEGSSPVFMTVRLNQLVAAIKNYRTQKPLDGEEIRTLVKLIEANAKPSAR
jgi:membrane protein DedA with SNARE-associated domain